MTDPSRFILKLGDLSFPLDSGRTYIVGSGPTCDIRIGHGSIADRHCEFAVGDALIVVTDLGSTTGTLVDGERIESMTWEPSQKLSLGEIEVSARRMGSAPVDKVPGRVSLRRREETFGELMAYELKRAPWFALSALIHAAALLALYHFWPLEDPLDPKVHTFALENQETEEDLDKEDDLPPQEDPEELPDEDVQDRPPELEPDEALVEAFDDDTDQVGLDEGALLERISSGTGRDILKLGKGALSGGFKKTVGRLRKSGLEIVFVFDSTGSMGAVLQSTKERIARMVDVLHALVPDSRIAIITYRDHGDSESYLTRSVPLSRDVYRSVNFMQRIYAGGGADEPEAVLDGLRAAFNQKWQKNSRRLVVLVGDAPPHKRTQSKIQGLVRKFVSNGRSFVHAFVTSPNGRGQMTKTTQKAFRKIASTGKGECLDFEDEAKILKAVLSLAFGRAYKRSLEEVYKLVDKRNKKISTLTKEIVRKADREQLLKQFSRRPVRDDLVRAILNSKSRAVTLHLIDFLQMKKLPPEGKHAASYIVQRLLD
ncbi:MAG: FHA domain-containing protein, partial [Planctomycetota bacterium]